MHRSLPAAAAAPQRTLLKTTLVFQKPSRRSGFVRDVKKNFRFLLFFFPNRKIVPLGGIFQKQGLFLKALPGVRVNSRGYAVDFVYRSLFLL